jgi:hypothetical protein
MPLDVIIKLRLVLLRIDVSSLSPLLSSDSFNFETLRLAGHVFCAGDLYRQWHRCPLLVFLLTHTVEVESDTCATTPTSTHSDAVDDIVGLTDSVHDL